jgi:hypothetical protein
LRSWREPEDDIAPGGCVIVAGATASRMRATECGAGTEQRAERVRDRPVGRAGLRNRAGDRTDPRVHPQRLVWLTLGQARSLVQRSGPCMLAAPIACELPIGDQLGDGSCTGDRLAFDRVVRVRLSSRIGRFASATIFFCMNRRISGTAPASPDSAGTAGAGDGSRRGEPIRCTEPASPVPGGGFGVSQ